MELGLKRHTAVISGGSKGIELPVDGGDSVNAR